MHEDKHEGGNIFGGESRLLIPTIIQVVGHGHREGHQGPKVRICNGGEKEERTVKSVLHELKLKMPEEVRVGLLMAPHIVKDLEAPSINIANLILIPEALHFEDFGHEDEYGSKVDLSQQEIGLDHEVLPRLGHSLDFVVCVVLFRMGELFLLEIDVLFQLEPLDKQNGEKVGKQ